MSKPKGLLVPYGSLFRELLWPKAVQAHEYVTTVGRNLDEQS